MPDVELLFLGTGTSAGVPMIACHCPVCDSTDPRDKRMRPSVVISSAGKQVLVDVTPEVRLQCVANRIDFIEAVVLTHGHADHLMGMDDLRRFNAVRNGPLDVWGDERTFRTVDRCFGYAFKEPDPANKLFRPRLIRRDITGPFELAGMRWTPIPLFHGEMPVLGFRIGRVAYCTDVNRIPDESYPLLEGLDVLVLDALALKSHATHFSLQEAVEQAQRIKAGRTYFTHIAHGLGHEATSKMLPEGIFLGYDGLRVSGRGED
jgi:phosphoribosyl 1,2-cyclic phosphate phosphodiesterase